MAENADGPISDYKPQGDGPHPTLAGNMFDPGVKADGQMSTGQGVGGVAESRVKEEGLEHIKSNTTSPTAPGSTPISAAQPPSSNPGAEDDTAGITSSSGGLSGTSTVNSPITDEQRQQSTMLGTVKQYLGMGGASGTQQEPRNADGSGLSGTEATAGAAGAGALGAGAASTIGSDPAKESTSNVPAPKDSDPTSGGPPTDSADPTTKDTAMTDKEQAKEGEGEAPGDRHGEKSVGKSAGTGGKESTTRENKDAIPTAGGEKLGQKHWGESKMVPDNPKPQEQEGAGISSSDGQPTQDVKDNTNKNTGGAAPPQHQKGEGNGAEKEGLVDKIKDKLHVGGSKS